MLGNWREIMVASGVKAGDRLFFAFSFGPFIGFWLAFETAVRLHALALPGGGLSSNARIRAMLDNQVTVLCSTPTYALRLAEVAAEENLPRPAVKRLLVAGEPGGSVPATRSAIQQAWPGATVFDHHGMTEVGPVTYQCPERECVLHVLENSYIAEIIEPGTGKAVAAGATGELVLTNLGRTGSPLLRYRTGDLVKPVVCSCGRAELALEGGILGRVDDMIIVRGVNVYPSAFEQIIRNVPGVAEYQVHVRAERALSEIAVTVEASQACRDTGGLIKTLENAFQSALALRVVVTLAPAGSLPRFEMKARRWVRE
jgi:phenylacetate-CoA ligase